MTRNRWIMYAHQSHVGGVGRLSCHESLDWCKESLRRFSAAVCDHSVVGILYAYTDEAWAEARRMEDVGCPFDYPDRIIERGVNGALRIERT